MLGPRGTLDAWAFTDDGNGRLLLNYTPPGCMEPFFDAWEKFGGKADGYSSESDVALLRQ